jgi:hypothetical protein
LRRSRSRICFLIALVSQGIFGIFFTLFSLIGACLSRTDKKIMKELEGACISNPLIDNFHYRLILKLGKEMQINHHS